MGHRRLKSITTPINQHLSIKSHSQKLKLAYIKGELSPPLQLAFLKGEGILRIRFFKQMEKMGFSDPKRQIELWNLLIIRSGYLLEFLQRVGLYSQIEQANTDNPESSCYPLYCILLDSLSSLNDERLLILATTDFFRFHIFGLYPKKITATTKKSQSDVLHHRALLKLRKLWGGTTELKESFSTTDNQVNFKLRLKVKNYSWQVLVDIQGERLKTTRIEAYNQLLEELERGRHLPSSVVSDSVLKPVASDEIEPLVSYK